MTEIAESLDHTGRAYAWQAIHGVSAAEAAEVADQLGAVDPRRVHYAALRLTEWRQRRDAVLSREDG